MITKLFSEKINCFMIDEDVSKYESISVFDNKYPHRGIVYDESGEVLDIMNIWHDCVLFSEDKKTVERFLKIERII